MWLKSSGNWSINLLLKSDEICWKGFQCSFCFQMTSQKAHSDHYHCGAVSPVRKKFNIINISFSYKFYHLLKKQIHTVFCSFPACQVFHFPHFSSLTTDFYWEILNEKLDKFKSFSFYLLGLFPKLLDHSLKIRSDKIVCGSISEYLLFPNINKYYVSFVYSKCGCFQHTFHLI